MLEAGEEASLVGADHVRRWWLWRRVILGVATVALLATPLPWQHVVSDDPMGTAWRLDGRLIVEGGVADPPGEWSWLAVGRPQLLGEWLWETLRGSEPVATDLRAGPRVRTPALAEPAAAAVGLRHAGIDIPMGLIVEVAGPVEPGLPASGVVVDVEGFGQLDRDGWTRLLEDGPVIDGAMVMADGVRVPLARAAGVPYSKVLLLDVPAMDLEARISFGLPEWGPLSRLRDLSVGSSHGMMVALVTYAHASGDDLAQGRHVAGTGGIRGDGSVARIGGLEAKTRAAKRAGADVLLYPASQRQELVGGDWGTMELVGVETLDEAIAWLESPVD